MDIYQKLLEVRKSVSYLKKDQSGFQFNYVSSSQTLGALRDKMDEFGLLLVPSVTSFEVRDHETEKKKHEYFTILSMVFKWIDVDNPDVVIECPWTGQGLDSGEKGVGKALTYAEKYFLLKFFNIATDKDDPDSYQNGKKGAEQKEKPAKEKPAEKKKLKDEKFTLLKDIQDLKKQIDQDEYYDLLKTVGVEKSNQLKPAVMPMFIDHLKKTVDRNERFVKRLYAFWAERPEAVTEILGQHGYEDTIRRAASGDDHEGFKVIKVKIDQITIFKELNKGDTKNDVSGG